MKCCPKCRLAKPLCEFYERKNPRWESERYHSYCKDCTLARRVKWYYKQGGQKLILDRQKAHRKAEPAFYRAKRQRLHWASKIAALNAYGGKCDCCPEIEPKFLAIDHTNGDGNKHRKTFTSTIYAWLRKHNYPPGFRVLCHNCNMAIAFWGVCPHKL